MYHHRFKPAHIPDRVWSSSLWLSLSGFSDKEKGEFLDAPIDPKAMFCTTMTAILPKCDLRKKEGEAFQVCLPESHQLDLFALRENTQCHLFFSLADGDALLGVDALAHERPDVLLYTFLPLK